MHKISVVRNEIVAYNSGNFYMKKRKNLAWSETDSDEFSPPVRHFIK